MSHEKANFNAQDVDVLWTQQSFSDENLLELYPHFTEIVFLDKVAALRSLLGDVKI
ncbi:hypothetical protein CCACVL1_01838 [Corchorus capsularis]|uniref:Uncharacterized protein n=1 Tax=Corchorus capsularis TaxID=210143 RepID=A0A1R3KF57_COCAP|nr:hypothetical protein CCACVL1_01838 [Corchorus capsularis]